MMKSLKSTILIILIMTQVASQVGGMTAGQAAALQGGASVAGGLFGSIASAFIAKRQRKHQMKMAEYAYSKDLEQWHRQNLYNSPVEQMKRLREAGLNPAMVYGHGTAANRATESPKYSVPNTPYALDAPDLGQAARSALGAYQDFRLRNQQLENMAKQREVWNQNILESINRSNERNLRMTSQGIRNKYLPREIETSLTFKEEQIASEKVKRQANELGMILSGKKITYQELMNTYQGVINDLAKDGIKLGDAWKVKALNELVKGAGYESISALANALGLKLNKVISDAAGTNPWQGFKPFGNNPRYKPGLNKKIQEKTGYYGAF